MAKHLTRAKSLALELRHIASDLPVGNRGVLRSAADELERLNLQPCPYVRGNTTKWCSLAVGSGEDT